MFLRPFNRWGDWVQAALEVRTGSPSQGGAGLVPRVPKKTGESERKREQGRSCCSPGGQGSNSSEVTSEQRQEGSQGQGRSKHGQSVAPPFSLTWLDQRDRGPCPARSSTRGSDPPLPQTRGPLPLCPAGLRLFLDVWPPGPKLAALLGFRCLQAWVSALVFCWLPVVKVQVRGVRCFPSKPRSSRACFPCCLADLSLVGMPWAEVVAQTWVLGASSLSGAASGIFSLWEVLEKSAKDRLQGTGCPSPALPGTWTLVGPLCCYLAGSFSSLCPGSPPWGLLDLTLHLCHGN